MRVIDNKENSTTEESRYLFAKKRVEKIKGFYIHTFITILLIPSLIFINLKFTPEYHWFWFSVGGLLIGLLFHWLGVFGPNVILGKEWEEKKLKEFMDQE